MTTRTHLSGEALIRSIRAVFGRIQDPRRTKSVEISRADAMMSAYAVFALKMKSLLAYDRVRKADAKKLKNLFGVTRAPCDTQMREIVDEVEPDDIRPAFKEVLSELQRGKALEAYVYYQGHYLIAADGTGYFSSDSVHCEDCLVKETKDGRKTYSHQMLAAAIVHPDQKIVFPLCPEPIKKQDGQTKNDCERNAGRRFIEKFRQDHPKMKAIFVEDALSANAPKIADLKAAGVRFILGAKPGNCKHLFEQVESLEKEGRMNRFSKAEEIGKKITKSVSHEFRYLNGLKLNDSSDVRVNFLEYWETTTWTDAKDVQREDKKHFSWITDFDVYESNLFILMRGGRARWRIENETFNTLKNQGYEFEHNYGHGNKHLSSCLGLLMMLAFLVDQAQARCCKLFQAALAKADGVRRTLWDQMRVFYQRFVFASWTQMLEALAGLGTLAYVPADTG